MSIDRGTRAQRINCELFSPLSETINVFTLISRHKILNIIREICH